MKNFPFRLPNKMTKLFTVLLLIFPLFQSHSLSVHCPGYQSEELLLKQLDESFDMAEVVVLLGRPIPTDSSTTRHKVLNVWKGSVGEYVYVAEGRYWQEPSLFFANRINGIGPLEPTHFNYSNCPHLSGTNGILKELHTLNLLKKIKGSGYAPDKTINEPKHLTTYLNWFFMFGFVFLVLVSMLTYSYVNGKAYKG